MGSDYLLTGQGAFRCEEIRDRVKESKLSAEYVSATRTQDDRFKTLKDLKNFRLRVLISTDLVSCRSLEMADVLFAFSRPAESTHSS